MNLTTKKQLAAKALKVGKNRIIFNQEGLAEIKEAITKQDIKSLHVEGIISIKPIKGRKKVVKRKTRRGPGKIKKKVKKRKQEYVKITRKLRDYLKQLKARKMLSRESYIMLRKKIRMREFRSKAHLKEYLRTSKEISAQLSELIKEEEERLLEKDVGKKNKQAKTKPKKTTAKKVTKKTEKKEDKKKEKKKPIKEKKK